MKKSISAILGLALAFTLQAQDQTVFNQSGRVGLFVSPLFEQGPLNEPWRTSTGGGLGVILGDAFVGFYGLVGLDYDQLLFDENLERVELAHGGLWLGFTPSQQSVIHPIANIRAGWGAVDIQVDDFGQNDLLDKVFVFSPELGLEINIARFLRIYGSGGYRWVRGINSTVIDDDDFTGWTGNLGLRIGWFGRNRRCHRN